MRFINHGLFVGAMLAASALSAMPARAAVTVAPNGSVTFDNTGGLNSVNIIYNGLGGDPTAVLTPGLSAVLTLTLTSISSNSFNFDYSMQNSSTVTSTRVSGFGFNVDPNVSSISSTGVFDEFVLDGQFASQGQAETCFSGGPGACPQSNPANSILFGATGGGTLSLIFSSPQTSITLSNFLDRYQGFRTTNINGGSVTSAVGLGAPVPPVPPVPEPGTWAMMLIGFGAMGFSLRRRRRSQVMPQVA